MSERHACPTCGLIAPREARFCAECGSRLDSAPSDELRKLVTILFCDLVGSTALGERLDPEAFRRVQLRYFAACETALLRHGGAIEKFIGDAVLCVFGIPAVREDDAIRACRAALALVGAIEELNLELDADWGVRLEVRIGINSGPVVAGDQAHGQTIVSGDAVNTAARLEQAAAAGEVLIGPMTRTLVADDAICVPMPPLSLKGKTDTVPTWRLVSANAHRQQHPRAADQPLVGREGELGRAASWLVDSDCGICLIVGPPGIGKSRLVKAIADHPDRLVLWGRCMSYGEGTAYAPVSEWLQALGEDAIHRTAGANASELLRLASGVPGTHATPDLIRDATCGVIAATAARQGVLIVVEDVHFASAAIIELIGTLAEMGGVAVVAAGRPEVLGAHPGLAGGDRNLLLDVGSLDPEAASTLVTTVAPELDEHLRDRLVRTAEGNPLVLVQLALHVAEGGDVERLPPSVDALLQARVANLSGEERRVAERGAVMGREFWDSGVAALSPDSASPDAAIALLVSRSFVGPGRADGAPDAVVPTLSRVFATSAKPYSFTSGLLRDAVYEAIPKLRRADLHELLGELLEKADAADELVAFHLERAAALRAELRPQDAAELAARAAGHLERAGEQAFARKDSETARAFLTRASTLLADDAAAQQRIEARLRTAEDHGVGTDLIAGDVVGGYRLRRVAGRGGMGVVYLADDLALGRQVAVKVIAPQLARDDRFRQRFARESRIAAGLEHPNVVPVYGAGEEHGRLYIAMRFVEGTDLQVLLRDGPLAPQRAVALIGQIADALDAAHARGLVHRDIKPANVLVAAVGGREQAYLTDFGLTRDAAGDGLTKTGQWVGTLAYVAPEQIRGEPVDARADVYALGAVLYEAVTGQPPFPVDSELEALAAHLDEPPPQASSKGAPRALDAVVERAMSKEPSKRFRAAGDLGRAAVNAVEGGRVRLTERTVATGAAAPVDVGRRRRGRSRRGVLLLGAGIGAVVAAIVVVAALAAGAFSGGGGGPVNPAGRVVGSPLHLPYDPDHLAVGEGRVWALLGSGGNKLMRIDPGSGRVDAFSAAVDLGGGTFSDVEVGRNAVWIAHTVADVGGVDHVDPETGEAVQHVPFQLAGAIAVTPAAVWAVAAGKKQTAPGTLVRIATPGDRITAEVTMGRNPVAVVVASGSVWVANRGADSVWRVDARTRRVVKKISVGDQPAVLAVSGGKVWVANLGDNTIMRIDPATNRVEGAAVSLGKEIQDIAGSPDALWVSAADGTVTRLDPKTGQQLGAAFSPAPAPLSLAVANGVLWVGSSGDRTLTRIEEATT